MTKKEKLKYQKQKYALKTYILNKIHMCGLKKRYKQQKQHNYIF